MNNSCEHKLEDGKNLQEKDHMHGWRYCTVTFHHLLINKHPHPIKECCGKESMTTLKKNIGKI